MGGSGVAVPRTGLLERAAAARVVLLRGPAGSGKSTVAEQLLAAWGVDALRVRIEDGSDRAALTAALARSLRRAGRGDDADALAAAPADDSIDRFVGLLAGRPGQTTIVLDDVHRLEPETAAGLGEALADLPARCRAIVAGRDLRGLADLGRRADSRVFEAEDLVLTATEVEQLLGEGATATLVAEVLDATDGWPAAVALAAGRLRREPGWSPAGAGGVRALLGDLVAELASADPQLRRVARLPLVDDDVVRLVGADPATVADLPTRTVGRWRTIAAPVREALAAGGADAAIDADVVVRIAAHYLDHGETGAGLRLLHEAAPPDRALAAVAARRWTELAELQVEELRAIVDDLAAAAPDDPAAATLLVEAARSVELTDRTLRSRWLATAIERSPAGAPTQRAALAEQARDRFREGDVDGGAAQAEAVLAAVGPDEPVTRGRALVTLAMRAAFTCTAESLDRAAVLHREAASLFATAGEVAYQAEALARLGYTALYFAGRPVEGEEAMAQGLALLPVGDRVRAFWLTNHADVLDFLGRDVEADAAVREALEIGARRHDDGTIGMAWWMRSWLAAHRGDAVGTKAALAEVERHRGPWLAGGQDVEYLASSAEHLALVGDVVGYRQFLERAATVGAECAYLAPVTLARMWFEALHGDPHLALSILDEVDGAEAVVPSNGPRRLLMRAVALHRAGEVDRARTAAAEAQAAAEAMGVPDLHARMHRPMLEVLGAAAPTPTTTPGAGAGASLRLLGGFSYTVGGEDRTPQPGHPATLVKLLALGGPLTTDAAIDALWPDAEPALGRPRLRNVLNRLKDRSGPLVVRDGEAIRLQDGLTVDAEAFEAAAAAALAAVDDERVGRARNALALYTGPLLPGDMYDDWCAAPRARLQRRYVSLADLVADDAVARGDLDEAARLLDLGITAEPLDEARTVKLCDLLTTQGRTTSARVVATRCADLLAELGIEPGPELARHLAR